VSWPLVLHTLQAASSIVTLHLQQVYLPPPEALQQLLEGWPQLRVLHLVVSLRSPRLQVGALLIVSVYPHLAGVVRHALQMNGVQCCLKRGWLSADAGEPLTPTSTHPTHPLTTDPPTPLPTPAHAPLLQAAHIEALSEAPQLQELRLQVGFTDGGSGAQLDPLLALTGLTSLRVAFTGGRVGGVAGAERQGWYGV
jgi:hypothetical protein